MLKSKMLAVREIAQHVAVQVNAARKRTDGAAGCAAMDQAARK